MGVRFVRLTPLNPASSQATCEVHLWRDSAPATGCQLSPSLTSLQLSDSDDDGQWRYREPLTSTANYSDWDTAPPG